MRISRLLPNRWGNDRLGCCRRQRPAFLGGGEGRTGAEVAARLYMSEATVKGHLWRVLAKLAASNRVQVAILVHDADLV